MQMSLRAQHILLWLMPLILCHNTFSSTFIFQYLTIARLDLEDYLIIQKITRLDIVVSNLNPYCKNIINITVVGFN